MANRSSVKKYRLITTSDYTLLEWKVPPTNILVIHKFCDENVVEHLKDLIKFISENWAVVIFLEPATVEELRKDTEFNSNLRFLSEKDAYTIESSPAVSTDHSFAYSIETSAKGSKPISARIYDGRDANIIDLVICLGGDGTFLKIGSMFQQSVPPVLAFRLGTLGFLAPFPFSSFQSHVRQAIDGQLSCLLRMRLRCEILRGEVAANGSKDGTESSSSRSSSPDKEYHFLNELVIDRGLSPAPCYLSVKVNGKTVTHFEGDGLIVSTPTGSTAYSMATGASLLHPCVPAFLLTPINSLTLSSRAIVLPMTLRIEISINSTARCILAHFSFDGRSRASNLIRTGDSILVTGSPYPVPCLSSEDQTADWFCGLNGLLNWNIRLKRPGFYDAFCVDEPQEHCDS